MKAILGGLAVYAITVAVAAMWIFGLRAEVTTVRAENTKLTTSLDQRTRERDESIEAGRLCSKSVTDMRDAADKRARAADEAVAQAEADAQRARRDADRILRTPAAVPGDDAASARQRVLDWVQGGQS